MYITYVDSLEIIRHENGELKSIYVPDLGMAFGFYNDCSKISEKQSVIYYGVDECNKSEIQKTENMTLTLMVKNHPKYELNNISIYPEPKSYEILYGNDVSINGSNSFNFSSFGDMNNKIKVIYDNKLNQNEFNEIEKIYVTYIGKNIWNFEKGGYATLYN